MSENYTKYFKTAQGGYFNDNEIKIYDKPMKSIIKSEINKLTSDDIEFSIIIFCGHGFYSTQSQSNILCLSKSERLDSLDLKENFRKRIIILDSCREPHDEYLFEDEISAFSADILKAEKQRLDAEACKFYYNKKIENCTDQAITLYGCSIGELCNDDSQLGGLYSSNLLKAAKDWVSTKLETINLREEYNTLPISSCHQNAVPGVIKRSAGKQNPSIEKPRTTDILPFCVVA